MSQIADELALKQCRANERRNKMDIKIGMIAPSKAGKTSLMTAIFEDMRARLSGNADGVLYWADSRATQNAITRAIAEFKACVAGEGEFIVPQLRGTNDVNEYKFSMSIPNGEDVERLSIDIMDYPGGLIGHSGFADSVQKHIDESCALLVPISTDMLMKWHETNGVTARREIRVNAAARCALDVDTVVYLINEWIARRAANESPSQLIFVPLKCESYYDDNGGASDRSEEVNAAVEELYVRNLRVPAQFRKCLEVEVHAVDTYGVTELDRVELCEDPSGADMLKSSFKKRGEGNELRTKGALELLAAVIRYKMSVLAAQIGWKVSDLERKINERTLVGDIAVWFSGDKSKAEIGEEIRKHHRLYEAMNYVSSLADMTTARHLIFNMGE